MVFVLLSRKMQLADYVKYNNLMMKQSSRRDKVGESLEESYFRNAMDEKNCNRYKESKIKIENLMTRTR